MCCLRYEQGAYEDLVKKVPKQGAFVETIDGYGTAVQVNLLRQTVKVRLDNDTDDTLRLFKANELAAVPGGRPKEGEPLPSVLHYVPEELEEETEQEDEWAIPLLVVPEPVEVPAQEPPSDGEKKARRRRGSRGRSKTETRADEAKPQEKKPESVRSERRVEKPARDEHHTEKTDKYEKAAKTEKPARHGKPNTQNKATVKPVKVESKPAEHEAAAGKAKSGEKSRRTHHRRYGKPKTKPSADN
jgi:hypothetical protein